nr:MAG TPA: hypothetical protein [Caudoviricetes sp.]
MEWCQVVKLPSATIPCFFLLLFIERKRQGLILGEKRLDRVVSETKRLRLLHTKRYESYQLIRMVCVGIVVYQSSSLPFFFFPPITPYYYLSISLSPFHETDKLFHVPTPRWRDNCDNGKRQLFVLRWFFPPTTLYFQKPDR